MKKIFIGLLFVILPCIILSNTTKAVEKPVATESVVVISESPDATLETQPNDYEECKIHWVLEWTETTFDFEDGFSVTIIEWSYYEECVCEFW